MHTFGNIAGAPGVVAVVHARRCPARAKVWTLGLGFAAACGQDVAPDPLPSPEVADDADPAAPPVPRRTLHLTPSLPAAVRYEAKGADAPNRWATALGFASDPALDRLATLLAHAGDAADTGPAVDALASWAGYAGPAPRVTVATLQGEACDRPRHGACTELARSLRGRLQTRAPSTRRGVGVATAARSTVLVHVAAPRVAALDPFARHVQDRAVIRGRLLAGRTRPRLLVTPPTGPVQEHALRGRRATFVATAACAQDGPHDVELMANGPFGPEVVFAVPIWCGVAPPDSIAIDVDASDFAAEPEAVSDALLRLINEARASAELAPLAADATAATAARAHAQDMATFGYLGHDSPRLGTLADRLRRASVRPAVARENVAIGAGPVTIHDALMNSPGHRRNILATDVTHVGIATTRDEQGAYVVAQDFIAR